MDAAEAKRVLRRALLAARADRPVDCAADAGRAGLLMSLVERLSLVERRKADTVALYVGRQGEPGTGAAIGALLQAGVRVLLPVLLPDRDLLFRSAEQVTPGGPLALVRGRLGLPVPPATAPVVPLSEAGLVVVPALAVDLAGRRLGRGGGSYDRALTRMADGVDALAVVHPDELVEEVPIEPHDRRVDLVFAGDLLHETSGRR